MKVKHIALAPGARVEIRDEEWVVRTVKAEASGGQAIRVTGVSELVRGKDAIFLTALDDIRVLRPEETELVPDTSSRFTKTRLYLESLQRRAPVSGAGIHLGHLAAIDPAEYQLRPAARALALLRPRFLMADGVGLGKTIEVGILLTELIRRGRGRRILVVAMKSILGQFQEELWGRFTIPLVRLDSVGIQRVQAKVPSSMNPFHYFDRVIISIDTLKNDVKYAQYLENCRWDVIVIDECQNVAMRTKSARGQTSQRYQLARLLAKQCDALILTSATPHDGSAQSFASLIRLLEPTAIADDEDFDKDDVKIFVQRKFKKDVAHQMRAVFPERETTHTKLAASAAEDQVFEYLADITFKTIGGERGAGKVLFRTTLLKSFLSSPAACLATIDERLAKPALDPERHTGDARAAAEADRASLTELRTLVERARAAGSPKYAALLQRVRAVLAEDGGTGRIVVFSERIDTLEFLAESLAKDCRLRVLDDLSSKQKRDGIATFHGSLDDTRQTDLVKSFGSADSPVRILLASDAAAEGINLHYFCHHLVHYDLPWSLITLVQRNGRIDRFGQKNTPWIHYLLTVPGNPELRGDLRVLDRLIEKEEQVQKNLGDPASLMNLHDAGLEEERIARAVQNELAPEVALPDTPATGDPEHDWFTDLFGGAEPVEPPIETHPRRSLFPTDLDFAREAFSIASTGASANVRWQDSQDGFDLALSDDLELRYEYLPPELTRDRLRLTTDRKRVMQSIELARQSKDKWPEWEYFWPLHPVCEWLDDQVLAALGRHEAWVVPIPTGLGPDDALFLFQGVLSNHNSQVVLVDWFAVPFKGGKPQPCVPFDAVLERTGLDRARGNPGAAQVPASIPPLRQAAVDAAREHMARLRRERAASVSEPLRQGTRELMRWIQATRQRIGDERLVKSAKGGTLAPAAARRLRAEETEAAKLHTERKEFIDRLRTVEEPYLRLAAVFVRADLA